MAATRDAHGRDELAAFREQAIRLGGEDNLVGILTLPDRSLDERPAVIVLNAGVLHRVGPHRMHVHLARRLAALGFATLRLDLAGIGDSVAVAGAQSYRESAVADTRAAMDGLTSAVGARRFILFGLCSGADNALAAAAVDPRVAAIVVIDPPTYRTRWSQARKLARRIGGMGARRALAWGLTVAQRRLRASTEPPPESRGRETPPLPTYLAQLDGLIERGVKVFLIFSGGLGDRYNQDDQLFEYAPGLRDRVSHAFFPRANHMFTERDQRGELVDTVAAWIDRSY